MRSFAYFILTFVLFASAKAQPASHSQSWEEVVKAQSGSITVIWHTSRPFVYKDESNHLAGIEYEIIKGFQNYLKNERGISLTINWEESESFYEAYTSIRDSKQSGILAISAFSITESRQNEVAFIPPYMSDITVLISSYDVPIVSNIDEFTKTFRNLNAITIQGTTYEQDLMMLRKQYNLEFDLQYIPSSENILNTIEKMDDAFGFIDLPIYLSAYRNNSAVHVNRQNLFPIRRVGYSAILPMNSDWIVPLEEYVLSQSFQKERDKYISKYLDTEVYQFIRNLYNEGNEDITLLTKEKEYQNEALIGKTEQIKKEEAIRYFLIGCVIVILTSLVIITRMYIARNRTAVVLQRQKEEIDAQRSEIEVKKIELEHHNDRLIELDEEKNHLISILAHDLRTPINQMAGLSEMLLMEKDSLNKDQLELIINIHSASNKLTGMITKILDVDKLDHRNRNIHTEAIDLTTFIGDARNRFRDEATKKGINLQIAISTTSLLHTDPIHLEQIIDNLLSNAIKFSSSGQRVTLGARETDELVELFVQDEGPGFTETDKKLMFRKFQRLTAKPTASESSSGLGLSIVKKYCEYLNAKIHVESEMGNGSTFIVSFKKHKGKNFSAEHKENPNQSSTLDLD